MKSKIGIIISREFSERVAKKSFLITTLLMPLLMVVLMAAPALIMQFSTPSAKTLAVIDESGIIVPQLIADAPEHVTYKVSDLAVDSLMNQDGVDGVIVVAPDIVENPSGIKLYLSSSSSMELEANIEHAVKAAVERERLKNYDINNLDEILKEINATPHLTTVRYVDGEQSESSSSALSFMVGVAMTFVLYMFLLLYGQMVMTSIIEEKNNRVLELVVSSIKPMQLMMGKIIGVGLVAVVQVVIWGALMCVMSAFLLPALMPAELSAEVAAVASGSFDAASASFDPDMVQVLSILGSVGYIAKLFGYMLLFLVGGFLFYASIFAAIGSAVDNIQDASQLQSFAILPIIVAIICSMTVASDPNSPLAFWMSMIPFTSPMVMLARVPFDIAAWQIWVSGILLYLSFIVMAWIAAKIYRVGIFMYGKKPTVRDLIRWARYK